ncbi:hypothetical protein [Streptomyces sp. NPDC047718]|uniref:hypothetical protein n=1 Tax=Streptomyces sp. NPDC047718 TaxID=3155479 RepID=UPI0033E9A44F
MPGAGVPVCRAARTAFAAVAAELVGKGGWLNTGGTELTLADLRITIPDFWIS